jgi:transcriptional regulator with XRE-family HTH domain
MGMARREREFSSMDEKQPNQKLRRERELRGWSQQTVAERVGTTEQIVCRWAKGEHKPNRHFQTQLCQLFEKNAEELGFLNEKLTKGKEKAQTNTGRENILEPSPLSSNNLLQPPLWERLSRILVKSSTIDEEGFKGLDQITKTYWRLRTTLGYRSLLQGFLGHLETVTRLLHGSQSPIAHKRLCVVASEIAQFIGAIYFDMNDYITARAYYNVSIETAQEGGNHTLWATALGRMASLPTYSNYPREALPLLYEAQQVATDHSSASVLAWLASVEAEAYAHLHNEEACLRSLAHSEHFLKHLVKEEDPYSIKFDYSRFVGYKGVCYLRLKQPELAITALTEGMNLTNSLSPRQLSIIIADVAEAYRQQGQIEEACKLAIQALKMTDQTKSCLVLQRLRKIRLNLEPCKTLQSVEEFDAHMRLQTEAIS